MRLVNKALPSIVMNQPSLIMEELFWYKFKGKTKPTQIERYESKASPKYIQNFIRIGGGSKMGVTMEEFARFKFPSLNKRSKGPEETGYDHKIIIKTTPPDITPQDSQLSLINTDTNENNLEKIVYVEQKSSGHWGENDYKWQHVEEKHKWNILLLCGIDYTSVQFWGMNREIFYALKNEKKITA